MFEEYEAGSRELDGRWLVPGCLDAYTEIAYSLYDPEEDGKPTTAAKGAAWDDSMKWLTAGMNVLQVSLPYPFRGAISYRTRTGVSVHRLIYAYASTLQLMQPKAAKSWFRAMVFLDPDDAMGARFHIRGAANRNTMD